MIQAVENANGQSFGEPHRHQKPPSQTWRTFLRNHMQNLVSADFFVVPTITFRVLFVFVILSHDRRRLIHFAVTANPTAEWTARQLLEAFPWGRSPPYLLRDRDGNVLRARVSQSRRHKNRLGLIVPVSRQFFTTRTG